MTPEMPAFEPRPSRLLRPARPDCANQIMTPPSVIIPRSATELKKAKQLNGTASARNNRAGSCQMSLSLASPPNCILAHLDVRTTLSTGTRGRCRMHGGMSPGAPKRNRNALRPLRGIEIDSQSCRAVGRGQLASRVGIICDDISEFESYMPSQAVRSPEANM